MPVDIDAAERFVYSSARLLDRHRLAVLLHGGPVTPVLQALCATVTLMAASAMHWSRMCVRRQSEPASTLSALDVLAEIGKLDDQLVTDAAAWIGTIADADGALPFVLPTAAAHPHAPWMVPSSGGSHLTFAIAARYGRAGSSDPGSGAQPTGAGPSWKGSDELSGYWVKFSLDFLDHVPDGTRAAAAIERLRSRLGTDGSVRVPGGTETSASRRWRCRRGPIAGSRALFTDEQVEPASTCSSGDSRTTAVDVRLAGVVTRPIRRVARSYDVASTGHAHSTRAGQRVVTRPACLLCEQAFATGRCRFLPPELFRRADQFAGVLTQVVVKVLEIHKPGNDRRVRVKHEMEHQERHAPCRRRPRRSVARRSS